MANMSIYTAFERMWQHVTVKLGDKANKNELDSSITEIRTSIDEVDSKIDNITSGSTVVKNAEHATSADSADEATHATSADSAITATSATKATQDGNGKVISSTYETKVDAQTKLAEAKAYADSASTTAATKVKNDLLNGAGGAYDTLKELGDLIDTNVDAIEALETVASGKADKVHGHAISDVNGLQDSLDEISEKANESDVLVVNVTGNATSGYTADKTFAEISEAFENDKYVYALCSGLKLDLTTINLNPTAYFESYKLSNMVHYILTITSENVINLTTSSKSATQYFYGGVKASAKSSTDTVEAKIGTDGKLYVPTYPSLDEYYTETEVDTKLSGKANATHTHAISDVSGLQSALDGKANASHGTHVSFDSTNKPKMDGTAAFGTSTKVARADHVHPTDTSRASQADLDVLESVVAGKANSSHSHSVATTSANGFMSTDMVSKLNGIASGANKTTVDSALSSSSTNPVQNKIVNQAIVTATNAITANTNSISSHSTAISNLQTAVSEIQEITSEEIQALFA